MVLSIPLALKIYIYFLLKPIDNAVLSMVDCGQMTEVRSLIADLKTKGWGNKTIADEIGVTVNAVEKWQADERNISRSHLILLTQLTNKKPPKRHRRAKDSRESASKEGLQNE